MSTPIALGINALTDVDTTTVPPTNGQILKWNGTNWTPQADDSVPNGTINQTLRHNGTNWVAVSDFQINGGQTITSVSTTVGNTSTDTQLPTALAVFNRVNNSPLYNFGGRVAKNIGFFEKITTGSGIFRIVTTIPYSSGVFANIDISINNYEIEAISEATVSCFVWQGGTILDGSYKSEGNSIESIKTYNASGNLGLLVKLKYQNNYTKVNVDEARINTVLSVTTIPESYTTGWVVSEIVNETGLSDIKTCLKIQDATSVTKIKKTPKFDYLYGNRISTPRRLKIGRLGDSRSDFSIYDMTPAYKAFVEAGEIIGGSGFQNPFDNDTASSVFYTPATGVSSIITTGSWNRINIFDAPNSIGLTGRHMSSSQVGAKITFTHSFVAGTGDAEKYTNAKLYTQGNGASYRVRIDGSTWVDVTTSLTGLHIYTIVGATNAAHIMEIEVVSGTLNLLGVEFENSNQNAITVYKLGHGSSAAANWGTLVEKQIWRDQLSAVNLDVIFVQLGTNDNGGGFQPRNFAENLDIILKNIRLALPNADIVVV
ncbi:MAG: SGNH/GDSL hydrolase family protein, partial [Waterburya sp.]